MLLLSLTIVICISVSHLGLSVLVFVCIHSWMVRTYKSMFDRIRCIISLPGDVAARLEALDAA